MKLQRKDKTISSLIDKLQHGKLNGFILEDEVLLKLRKGRNRRIFKQLVVPQALKLDILRMCHDDFTGAHLGQVKTWVKLNNRFYWPGSYKDTFQYVDSCETCARMKEPPANRAHMKPITDFDKPFDKVGVDILELSTTNNGNKYVLIFTDYLTKWVEAYPMKNMKAETIAQIFVYEFFTRHSAPSHLISDQGANFRSELIRCICELLKVNKLYTAPYNPRCDGLTERFNKTLCKMLAAYSNSNQTNWDLYLPLVLFGYRTSEQSTTLDSPFALLYGREARLGDLDNYNNRYNPSEFIQDLHRRWKEAKDNVLKHAEINKDNYDSKYQRKPVKYNDDDFVRLKIHTTKPGLKKKLRNDLYSEPVKINKVLSDQNVEVKIGNKNKVVNVNNLKKKEPDRSIVLERINPNLIVTRYGRTTKPRINTY